MFEERERGFEAKFAHDEALKFMAHARRNKLFGLWAAGRMRRTGPAAHRYAVGLATDFGPRQEDALIEKVAGDLAAATVAASRSEIAAALAGAADRAEAIVRGR